MIGTDQVCREGRNDLAQTAGPGRPVVLAVNTSGDKAGPGSATRRPSARSACTAPAAITPTPMPSSAMRMTAESALLSNSRTGASPNSAHSSSYSPVPRAQVRIGQRTQSAMDGAPSIRPGRATHTSGNTLSGKSSTPAATTGPSRIATSSFPAISPEHRRGDTSTSRSTVRRGWAATSAWISRPNPVCTIVSGTRSRTVPRSKPVSCIAACISARNASIRPA